MDTLTLKERASNISKAANALADDLASTSHPEPTFEHGLPDHLHGDAPNSRARTLKQQLLTMVNELQALLTEPSALLVPEMRLPTLSVNPIVRLGIAEIFPENGTTVTDLAESLNIRRDIVRRLLAHSATHHIFYEAAPDFFVHTAASRHLSKSQGMRDWIRVGAEEVLPGTLKIAEALERYPNSEEPEHCGWSISNNTTEPVFRALANHPTRAAAIASGMKYQMQKSGFAPRYLTEAFPWNLANANAESLKIVDVGGGLGHISRALAGHDHPAAKSASFIVQDLPDIIAAGGADLPGDLKGRVEFRAHDFFETQPVRNADVYLLRSVLHDWSDKYAAKILEALVPALKRGAKILINERVVPGWHEVDSLVERHYREFDMTMLGFQNALERTKKDWEGLIRATDERFELTDIRQQEGSFLAVIEVTWKGE